MREWEGGLRDGVGMGNGERGGLDRLLIRLLGVPAHPDWKKI